MVHRSESELSLDNRLFEQRIKEYGAYEIRSVYNSYLRNAAIIAVLIFSFALVLPKIVKMLTPEEVVEEEFVVQEVKLEEIKSIDETKATPPPPPPNFEPPAPAPQVASQEFLPPKVMEDKDVVVEKEPPTQAQLHNTNPGAETREGETENLNAAIVSGDGSGNKEVEDVEAPRTFVGEMPTFDGDYEKFVKKYLIYPESAKRDEINGKVHLKFVVEKDGTISDITVTKSLRPDCDEAAIRFVKSMSGKWKPGKNNGIPVRVWKSLPVNFKYEALH